MAAVSFAELLAPLSVRTFLDNHWQRRPLWISSATGRTAPATDLVTLADVEWLVGSLTSPDANWLKLVRAGSPPRPLPTRKGSIHLPTVQRAYRDGYTLQLAKMHKRWAAAGRLCRSVEEALLAAGAPLAQRIGAHLHLTPPGASARPPHYHVHDNLVVQLAGTKLWHLYGTADPYPVRTQSGGIDPGLLRAPRLRPRLRPGQLLYLPRGMVHQAWATEGPSLHLTLDVTPVTWLDLAAHWMKHQAHWRRALPRHMSGTGTASPALAAAWDARLRWALDEELPLS